MNMSLPKYSKGFTLLELLISISIIGIIAGGIIPSFSGYIKNQNLQQAQEMLKSELRTIQNKALTGALSDLQIPQDSGNYAQYWGVYFSSDSGATVEYFVSASNAPCLPVARVNQGTFKLSNDVKYYGNPGCMFFNIRNGDITTTTPSEQIILNFTDKGPGDSSNRYIHFNPSGLIY